ncbi:MAG: RluA family pseudouridine synthase [Clostridia bacterium]|nr:RluA family pseudouridine synthase [Clostridia bacterium]
MKTLEYTVGQEDDNRVIWRIVRGRMGVSARQLSRAKVAGTLLLNGEQVHADRRVKPGQVVSISIYDDEPSYTPEPEDAEVSIVYEDDDILVIDKPAPLATQSSPKQPDNTLENRLAFRFSNAPGFIFRPINRLDKGTSGLMLAAKHAHAQLVMSAQLHTPDFVREYLAICEGIPDKPEGTIDLPIGKKDGATVKREIRQNGKPSVTHYRVVETHGNLSLVSLRLETGRTHQIRVHMSAIGCPVAGDFLYGRELKNIPGRFALHSARVSFLHPSSKKRMEFESPLPKELERLLSEKLEYIASAGGEDKDDE